MQPAPSVRFVLASAGTEENALEIARSLTEEGIAACVSLVPKIRSLYRWKGKVEDETEVLMVIKTRDERLEELERTVRRLHKYEVPEIVALPVEAASAPYLQWLLNETERKI